MIFLKRSAVFPYPAVQYIPIRLTVLERFPVKTGAPFIAAQAEPGILLERIERVHGIKIAPPPLGSDEGLLLAERLEFREVLYRGSYVTILGGLGPAEGFIAGFPLRYFYKNPLVFQVRTENGVLLASTSLRLPEGCRKCQPALS